MSPNNVHKLTAPLSSQIKMVFVGEKILTLPLLFAQSLSSPNMMYQTHLPLILISHRIHDLLIFRLLILLEAQS